MTNTTIIGTHAENAALNYLTEQGLKLIVSNYRCKSGEIDLIMNHKHVIVFVEVRYRARSKYGSGAETVDIRKQKKLLASASHFLQNNKLYDRFCRFDVISIQQHDSENTDEGVNKDFYQYNWIQNAFQA